MGFEGKGGYDQLYENGHYQNNKTKITDKPVQEIKDRDDQKTVDPIDQKSAQGNDLFK